MQGEFAFRPDRRMGLFFLLGSISFSSLIGIMSLWLADHAGASSTSALYLLLALATVVVVSLLLYRVYALQTAQYTLEREGILLRWGLRSETIPMDKVLWIHPADELTAALPRPRVYFPGAILGKRRLPGNGIVEYLASEASRMLFIATDDGGFVISPADPDEFLLIYQRLTEMGSLVPLKARSVYPVFLFQQVWSNVPARILLICCTILSLGLFTGVIFSIPSQSEVHFGFYIDGSPGDVVPTTRLILLPLLNFFYLIVGGFLGLYFFRRNDTRPFTYILWGANTLTAVLFILAVFFILEAG